MKCAAVILAAGEGTRMKSTLPKVLHPILGKPMAQYAIEAVKPVSDSKPIMVVGHQAQEVKVALGEQVHYVLQEEQLGTGHAVQQAEPFVDESADLILITNADMPLVSSETLSEIVNTQRDHQGPLTMLTVEVEDPRGFGRIIRGSDGKVKAIVEEVDATEEQLEIKELNAAVYCVRADWLWSALPQIDLSPQGEYYLTDLVEIAVAERRSVQAVIAPDPQELIGVNNRLHLAQAAKTLREMINERWMLSGVTITDPARTYIEPDVKIGQDALIRPNTHLEGKTTIGEGAIIGPDATLQNAQIGERCHIRASTVEESVVEDDVDIGPYSHLRRGAHLARGVHIGNYCEVKEAFLDEGTKMGHFSYIGNARVGKRVNIGAGTITCNYDGTQKHLTTLGDDVFIGSDTMLVAPVELGDRARTGAGAVVTKDIPPGSLAVGVPARVIRKEKDRSGEEG